MAEFDAQYAAPHVELTPEQQLIRQVQDLQAANQNLGTHNINLVQQNQFLMGQQNQNFQNNHFPPQQAPHMAPCPNLNLPEPKSFSGVATELSLSNTSSLPSYVATIPNILITKLR